MELVLADSNQPDSPSQLSEPLMKQRDGKESNLYAHLSLNGSFLLHISLKCIWTRPSLKSIFPNLFPKIKKSVCSFGWCLANMFSCSVDPAEISREMRGNMISGGG